MSKRVKVRPRASQVEMGSRVLKEFEEAARRRADQILKEAAPRFRDKGWKVTETKERQA